MHRLSQTSIHLPLIYQILFLTRGCRREPSGNLSAENCAALTYTGIRPSYFGASLLSTPTHSALLIWIISPKGAEQKNLKHCNFRMLFWEAHDDKNVLISSPRRCYRWIFLQQQCTGAGTEEASLRWLLTCLAEETGERSKPPRLATYIYARSCWRAREVTPRLISAAQSRWQIREAHNKTLTLTTSLQVAKS